MSAQSEGQGIGIAAYTGKFKPLAEEFQEVRSNKRVRHFTETPPRPEKVDQYYKTWPTLDSFNNMDTEDKLSSIYEVLSSNLAPLKLRVDSIESNMFVHMARLEVDDKRLRLLEYKSIDLEVKTRACNLLFTGMNEQADENCSTLVNHLLVQTMLVDEASFKIKRAIRVGRKKTVRGRFIPRAILVTFTDSFEVNNVLSYARNLGGSNISINRDYPPEIADARKELWSEYKKAKVMYGAKNVKLKFPAAIEIKGVVVQDKFPDWNQVLKGSRHTDVKEQVSLTLRANTEKYLQTYMAMQQQCVPQMATSGEPDTYDPMNIQVAELLSPETESDTETETLVTDSESVPVSQNIKKNSASGNKQSSNKTKSPKQRKPSKSTNSTSKPKQPSSTSKPTRESTTNETATKSSDGTPTQDTGASKD